MDSENGNLVNAKDFTAMFLRILAIVADVVGIVSFLLLFRADNNQVSLGIQIAPFLALGIWVISAFTYLGFVQRFWQVNQQARQFQTSFGRFLQYDLIRRFREPFLLLPAVILIILFIWMTAEIILTYPQILVILSIIAILVAGIGLIIAIANGLNQLTPDGMVRNNVDKKWKKWDRIIQMKLGRKCWIAVTDLADQAEVLGVSIDYLEYALSKYAIEHPKQTTYGVVYYRKNGKPATQSKVLISLKNLSPDEYFYTS